MTTRVLAAHDKADFLQLLEFNLVGQGFQVTCAANGMQALRKARSELPDLVLLDLMLPDLDGFSVSEILHAQPSTRDIPVILLTSFEDDAIRIRGAQANVSLFFTKG